MSALKAIFLKELKVEFRNKQMINSYIILALMILVAFRFSLSIADTSLDQLASPILWITFFFSGMFSLSLTYKREVEHGTQEGLLLAPISPASIYFGKLLTNLIVIYLLELFVIIVFFAFFSVTTPDLLALFIIISLGTLGVVSLGNIISAISANLEQSEVMLPVLLIPVLLFTVIMSSVTATSKVFTGSTLFDVMPEIRIILAFGVVFLAVGYLLIDYVLET